MTSSTLVVCVRNAGYEASLDCGKRYRLLPDAEAAGHRQVRIIDESGEDYLYPESCFSSANEITICCADIGSIRKGRFGWASLTTEPDARESAGRDIRAFSDLSPRGSEPASESRSVSSARCGCRSLTNRRS